MKNKMLAIVLAAMFALGAVACGDGDTGDTGGTATEGGGAATEETVS